MSKKQKEEQDQIEKNQQTRNDIEFEKWLKQRSNLGIDDFNDEDDDFNSTTVNKAKTLINSKKDPQKKELQALNR